MSQDSCIWRVSTNVVKTQNKEFYHFSVAHKESDNSKAVNVNSYCVYKQHSDPKSIAEKKWTKKLILFN